MAAHELGHIVHRDTLLNSRTFALIGWVRLIRGTADEAMDAVDAAGRAILEATPANLLALLAVVAYLVLQGVLLVIALIADLWALVACALDCAISRKREYMADAFGAIVSNPLALASALMKLEAGPELKTGGALVGPLCTLHHERSHPFWGDLFATHPTTEARVAILWRMAAARDAVERQQLWQVTQAAGGPDDRGEDEAPRSQTAVSPAKEEQI